MGIRHGYNSDAPASSDGLIGSQHWNADHVGHDKALHDALGIDASTLGGHPAADFASAETDSGYVQNSSAMTAATGWSLVTSDTPSDCWYRKVGNKVYFGFKIQRDGATVTSNAAAGSDGDMANTAIATLPAAIWPARRVGLTPGPAGTSNVYSVDPNGSLYVNALAGQDATIATGEVVSGSGEWLVD